MPVELGCLGIDTVVMLLSIERGQHVVRFYDRDDELCQILADFVTEGVRRGERIVLLVARPAR